MSVGNFEIALKYVLVDEGGNDDDPRDHGGRTSRGITQREYDSWCSLNGKRGGDVWKATAKEIHDIYRDQYWNPYCDSIPAGLDYLFFDISVNSGRTRAVQQFQKGLGIKVDGMMGQVTLDKIQRVEDVPALISTISHIRRDYYRNLAQFPIYGKGWLRRVEHCQSGAMAMTTSDSYQRQPTEVNYSPGVEEQTPSTTSVSPETSTVAGVSTGGLSEMLAQLKDSLLPFAHEMKIASYILISVTVAFFAYAAYGFVHRNKVNKAMQT